MRASRLCFVVCGVVCGLLLLDVGTPVAQQRLPFVRQSSRVTPTLLPPDVIRQQRVDIAGGASLLAADESRELRLELFPDVTLRALRQRLEPTASGMSWIGRADGYPESDVIFVVVGDELLGNVFTPFGVFRIAREVDGYLVQQIDLGARQEINDAVPTPETPPSAAGRAVQMPAIDNGSLIDVMVLYTQQALTGFVTETRARAAIDLAIAGTNQAFRNSAINTAVRLVHAQVVDFAESGTSQVDLPRLQGRTDGFIDEIHPMRDRAGADLVVLITETMTDAGGRGYLNTMTANGVFGFSVVARRSMGTARSFAHELGHNLGAHHDWYVESGWGAFRYSKGYVSVAGRFLDVMAYFDLCGALRLQCTALLQFSNPRIVRDGQPTGIPSGTNLACPKGNVNQVECDADSAGAISQMAAVVARFRAGGQYLLTGGQQLTPGESVLSENRAYRLVFQTDGNLVFYDDRMGAPLWATYTQTPRPGRVVMQADGNLVVYDAGGVPLWSSSTGGQPFAYLVVQNDGNLVIYSPDGPVVWHRFMS